MISDYIMNFHSNLDGLRDFVLLIEPVLDDQKKKITEKHDNAFKPLFLAQKKYFATKEEDKKKYEEELKEIFQGEIEIITTEIEDSNKPEDAKVKKIRYRIKGDTSTLDDAFTEMAKATFHSEQLYKSSLINLVSSVEWFFSQILHFYYDKFPEAAGIKNRTLTLEDLKSFESVRDAEAFLIDNKIEDILRGSIKDWFKLLKDDLKLSMGYNKYENLLIEIYQRRNVLIHNGGVVNSIYLSKVDDEFKKEIKTGEKLNVTKDYLDDAISYLELVFTLIASELWKKLDESDEIRSAILMQWGYKLLTKNKWYLSESVNQFILQDKKMPVAARTVAQLNVWLCKKELNGYIEIKKDIENADFSDKSLVFQLALAALKNDKNFFFKNLSQALKNEDITPQSLLEFPIMREMREAEEFVEFKRCDAILSDYLKTLTN